MTEQNEAKVTVERSEKKGKGTQPVKTKASWIVPVDLLVGDANAKVNRGRDVKHGLGYGDYSSGSWVSVTLTCNQDDDTMRKAVATAHHIVEKIITREDKRIGKIVDDMAKELSDANQ